MNATKVRAHPISLVPIVCYGVLVGFAVYAAVVVGHWPYYSHPDPKNLPVAFLSSFVALVMLVGLASVILIPLGFGIRCALAVARQQPVQPARPSVVLFAVGAALWVIDFLLIHVGRHSLISWIMD